MGFSSEKVFQRDVKRALESVGSWILNFHGHGFGKSGIPDLFVANTRWSGWIELKVGKNRPTPLQIICMKDLLRRGVPAFVVRGYEQNVVCELWYGDKDYEILSFCEEWDRKKGITQGSSILDMLIEAGDKAIEIVKGNVK
jgi:hypothetical protein